MTKELREAIQYVHDNILMEDVRATIMVQGARGTNSLNETDPMNLKDRFFDLMEEYGADNDLHEGWWLSEVDEDEILSYVVDCDNGELEDAEREVRIRAVVLLPGDNKIDLVDFECEPDDVEQELIEHYGHSQFLYMAGPTCEWHMRHKYIDGLGESEVIEEKML